MRRTIVSVVAVLVLLSSLFLMFDVDVVEASDSNVNTYVNPESQRETCIAVNPRNPDNIVIGFNDFTTRPVRPSYTYSTDGGDTWVYGGSLPQGNLSGTPFCDPWLAFDGFGYLYYVALSRGAGLEVFVCVGRPDGNANVGPLGFGAPQILDDGLAGENDKPVIAVDTTAGVNDGNVYVAWCHKSGTGNYKIWFRRGRRTDPTTITWMEEGFQVSPSSELFTWGPQVAVGPNGEVFVAHLRMTSRGIPDADTILLSRSLSGGAPGTWTRGIEVSSVDAVDWWVDNTDRGARHMSAPSLCVSKVTGTIFVAWADDRNGDDDILLSRSEDEGDSWLPLPIRVNDDTLGNGNDQLHPAAVVSSAGVLDVVFYDRRDDPANKLFNIYLARSWDEGDSWDNYIITDEPTDPDVFRLNGGGLGDYIGIASTTVSFQDRTLMAWADGRVGTSWPSDDNTDIFFDSQNVSKLVYNPYFVMHTGSSPIKSCVPLSSCPIEIPLQILSIYNFQEEVSLTAGGLPTGSEYSFEKSSGVPPFETILYITLDPGVLEGMYEFNVRGSSDNLTISKLVEMELTNKPYVTLDTVRADPGETVTLKGHGFTPNASYSVMFDGEKIQSGTVNSVGSVFTGLDVPVDAIEENHTVTVDDGEGVQASTHLSTPRPETEEEEPPGVLIVDADGPYAADLDSPLVTIQYTILDGAPPYTVQIDWGDGSPLAIENRTAEGTYTSSHEYTIVATNYTISLTVIDSIGSEGTDEAIATIEQGRDWPMFHHDLNNSGYSSSTAPNTNRTRWMYNVGISVSSSPVVVAGKIYFGADDTVYCLNAFTGESVWNYTRSFPFGGFDSGPAVVGDRVFVGAWDWYIYCLNASTGEFIWSYRTENDVFASPAVADGRVYIGSWDDWFYCLNASTGELVWRYKTGYDIQWSSAAVADGRVYVGSMDHNLYCLDASTGTLIWNYTTGKYVSSAPAVVDGKVYVGSVDHKVYCLDALTGAQIWNFTTGDDVYSSPAVAYDRVYVGSDDWNVYCLNATTGAQIWKITTSSAVYSSPAVAGDKVYVGSDNFNVYCFDALTGALVWKYKTGGYVRSSPAIASGQVYIGSFDGTLYAFGGCTGEIWVPDQYPTIQAAIDAACDGAVINVVAKSEPYYEQINIYKSVTLIGHDMPVIDGGDSGTFVNITHSDVSFSGFKIQCTVQWEYGTDEYGIALEGVSNCTIENSYFNGTRYGITLENCSDIKIFNNHFFADMDIYLYVHDGITIRNSSNNQIRENEIDVSYEGIIISGINSYDNTVTYNVLKAFGILGKGIYIEEDAHDNTVSYNEMLLGPTCFCLNNARDNVVSHNRFMAGGLVVRDSSGNLIFHNSFWRKPRNVYPPISGFNAWSLGFPMGGNYWIFHESPDVMTGQYQNLSGSDAIGEKVYELGPGNIDRYPLKGHSYMFPVRFKSVDYVINIISNSTISDFQIDPAESVITLQANGSEGTGFCRVGIPGNLTFEPYTVYVNGEEVPYTMPYSSSTIYFTYIHLTEEERARHWPMFHNELTRSGYSTSSAPSRNFTLWSYNADDLIPSSPVVIAGKIYFGSQDKNVYCLNASTGTKIWNYTTGGTANSPAVVSDRVYVSSTGDKIYCLDASTGALIWNYTTYAGDSSPAVVNGRVYVSAGDGWFYCLDASTGELKWKYESLAAFEMSSAAVVDGRVYVGSMDHNLYCLNASTGTLIWNYTTGDLVYSSPAVADGKVYVGSADHNVYCLDAFTGTLIWNYTTGGSIKSSPGVSDNRVYIGSADLHANVYCLNATTGAKIWTYKTDQAVHSSPAVADGRVYVGSYDENVYCFDALTGALVWKYKTGGYVRSSPAIADGQAYIGSFDGTLYAFGGPTISLSAGVNGTIHTVSVISNSIISDFSFDESLRTISFSSTGTLDTPAFFNLTFPTILLRGPFTVLEDGSPLAPVETYTGTLTSLYAEYMNALHTIEVIGTTTITESTAISVDPLTIDFPQNHPIDHPAEMGRIIITNIGGEPLTIESITLILNEGDTYAIDTHAFLHQARTLAATPFILTSGQSASVTVWFNPNDLGRFMGTLQIMSNDPINSIVEVSLLGSGGPPSCPPYCTTTVPGYTTDEEGEWWVEIPVGGTITETVVSSIFNILRYNINLTEHDQGLLVNGTLEHPYFLGQMRLEVKSRNSTEKTRFFNIIITPYLPVVSVYPVNWDGYSFDVTILSNSTISDFAFSQPEKRITFDVTVPANMSGYCNVTIPMDLLGGPYICLLNGSPVTVIETSNSTHASLYITYTQDGYIQITGTTVIPEFPTTITTLLLLALLSLALLLCRRTQSHITNKNHLPY